MAGELEALGFEVEVPALPTPNKPNINKQVSFALKNGSFDEKTIVIGHSAGSLVAQKVIQQLEKPVAGMILIG